MVPSLECSEDRKFHFNADDQHEIVDDGLHAYLGGVARHERNGHKRRNGAAGASAGARGARLKVSSVSVVVVIAAFAFGYGLRVGASPATQQVAAMQVAVDKTPAAAAEGASGNEVMVMGPMLLAIVIAAACFEFWWWPESSSENTEVHPGMFVVVLITAFAFGYVLRAKEQEQVAAMQQAFKGLRSDVAWQREHLKAMYAALHASELRITNLTSELAAKDHDVATLRGLEKQLNEQRCSLDGATLALQDVAEGRAVLSCAQVAALVLVLILFVVAATCCFRRPKGVPASDSLGARVKQLETALRQAEAARDEAEARHRRSVLANETLSWVDSLGARE